MNATRPMVLILDDEERIRELLIDSLGDYDEFGLGGAGSAEEALGLLARQPVDLCMVDIRLPGMDGAAFILAARESGLCPRFIVHTGSVGLALTEEMRGVGLTRDDVFLKPADIDKILERIRERLRTPVHGED